MPEEEAQQGEGRKGGLMPLIISVAVAAVVSIAVTFLMLNLLGSNKPKEQKTQDQQELQPAEIKAILIQPGSMYTFMLKGGKNVVVIDSLSFKVGSDQCRAAIAEKKDEILDAIQEIFLRKEFQELGSAAGLDLLKKQIKDAVNRITGFVGEREKFGVARVFLYIKAISSVE